MRLAQCIAVLLLAFAASSQTHHGKTATSATPVSEPPAWNFPENLKPSVPKELLSTLAIGDYQIRLEETSMKEAQQRLGGEMGAKGDAGDALEWLCFHGSDAEGGWVLWLESGEIDGGNVGSFQWQRLTGTQVFDRDCHTLAYSASKVTLPLPLRLGADRAEVLNVLGSPTSADNNRLVYFHEHDVTIEGQPFTSWNIVLIRLRDGVVWAIQVSKTTSS